MNAVTKMILAEQIAAMMNAYFIERPSLEDAAEILKVAIDQYQNYLDAIVKEPKNIFSVDRGRHG